MHVSRFLHELECLNLGILGPSISNSEDSKSIDAALSLLSPEEARKVKRKFRKVARKIIAVKNWKKMTRMQKRNRVRRELYMRCVLRSYNLADIKDNDP